MSLERLNEIDFIMKEDNRKRVRYDFNYRILCNDYTPFEKKNKVKVPFLFEIINISYGGLGIITEQSLHLGDIFCFNFTQDYDRRLFKVEVVWVKYEKFEGNHFGVKFLELTREDIIFLYNIIKPLENNSF